MLKVIPQWEDLGEFAKQTGHSGGDFSAVMKDMVLYAPMYRAYADWKKVESALADPGAMLPVAQRVLDVYDKLCIDADGPFKVFVNGKQLACDPNATNPMRRRATLNVTWKKGRNEIVIAQRTSKGAAWGFRAAIEP